MKTLNKVTLLTGLFVSSILVSCKKEFLDRSPYTQIPSGDAVNTVANMNSALTGTYAGLRSTNIYGRTLPVFGDLLADNVFVSVANSGRYLSESTYSVVVNDADVQGLWNDSYNDILRANNIINSSLNTDDVKQIKGEAYALRALNYFNLVKTFAKPYTDDPASPGVPLVLTYDPTLLPKRSTVSEVYTQILADLDQAYSLMSSYRGSAYFSKYAARALAAKVNLYKGDYQTAYTDANDVINNSGFTLVGHDALPGYFASQNPHDAGTKVETLFEVVSDAINNNSYDELAAIYSQGTASLTTYGDLLTTASLYNSYNNTDARKSLILDTVRQKAGGENPAYVVNKYQINTSTIYGVKKVIRLADVYLIAAEAAARLNNADGLVKLNALMAQRDPSLVYTSSGTQLINDIINERRKELAFEGDRFFDLNRLKLAIPRTSEYKTGAIAYGDTRRVLPIPQGEINVNPNVTQNAGY